MIISFFGHRDFITSKVDVNDVIKILEDVLNGDNIEFYLGCYGNFDYFAYDCAKAYRQKHGNCKLIFVTPYLQGSSRCKDFAKKCDESIYPNLEKVPLNLAILERNKWVIDRSDFIVFYRSIGWGTAFAYDYAERKKKKFVNLYK